MFDKLREKLGNRLNGGSTNAETEPIPVADKIEQATRLITTEINRLVNDKKDGSYRLIGEELEKINTLFDEVQKFKDSTDPKEQHLFAIYTDPTLFRRTYFPVLTNFQYARSIRSHISIINREHRYADPVLNSENDTAKAGYQFLWKNKYGVHFFLKQELYDQVQNEETENLIKMAYKSCLFHASTGKIFSGILTHHNQLLSSSELSQQGIIPASGESWSYINESTDLPNRRDLTDIYVGGGFNARSSYAKSYWFGTEYLGIGIGIFKTEIRKILKVPENVYLEADQAFGLGIGSKLKISDETVGYIIAPQELEAEVHQFCQAAGLKNVKFISTQLIEASSMISEMKYLNRNPRS